MCPLLIQVDLSQGLMLDEVTLWPRPRTEGVNPSYDPNHYIEEHSKGPGMADGDATASLSDSLTLSAKHAPPAGVVYSAAAAGLAAGLAVGAFGLRSFLRGHFELRRRRPTPTSRVSQRQVACAHLDVSAS